MSVVSPPHPPSALYRNHVPPINYYILSDFDQSFSAFYRNSDIRPLSRNPSGCAQVYFATPKPPKTALIVSRDTSEGLLVDFVTALPDSKTSQKPSRMPLPAYDCYLIIMGGIR